MGTGYTRQSSGVIIDAGTIEADDLNAEFNQLQSAFNATTGHSHDGTSGEGPLINLTSGVTGTLPVANGGIGAATLTDGGILLGNGTGAIVAMSVLTDGQIVIGDGTTDPTTLAAFTSSTGTLKHEYGGLEADISAYSGLVKVTGGTTSAVTITSAGEALLDDASAPAMRTTLGLAIGTDVQAYDAELAALAGLTSAANKIPMFSGSGTASLIDFKDEDDMISDSATAVPSQQSVKAYVDSQTVSVGADLTAIEALSTTGILARTAANTWAHRTITGTLNKIDVTNGDGVSGAPTLTISSGYVGQTSITTLGTIGTGVWEGTAVAVTKGGTGSTTASAARTALGLAIGTDVQAYSTALQAISAVGSSADKLAYYTGSGTASLTDFTSFARTIVDDADASTMRTTLGVGTGDSPQFTALNIGHATDTTIARGAAGFIAVEGNRVPSPASQVSGDILYRGTTEWERLAKGTAGQVLTMNAGATAPEWAAGGGNTLGTEQTSVTALVDYTGIPSGVTEINIMLEGIHDGDSNNIIFQIGDSGGVEATGYVCGGAAINSGSSAAEYTTGFIFPPPGNFGGNGWYGVVTLRRMNGSHKWAASGTAYTTADSGTLSILAGTKTLTAELDRVRITSTAGDLDGGNVNISYR